MSESSKCHLRELPERIECHVRAITEVVVNNADNWDTVKKAMADDIHYATARTAPNADRRLLIAA